MLATQASGKLQRNESEIPLDHIIFRICLQCHCNTLRPSQYGSVTTCGPGYRCPQCHKSSFVPACTICHFDFSTECPLTELLDRRPIHERKGRGHQRNVNRYSKEDMIREPSVSRDRLPRILEICPTRSSQAPETKRQCRDILKQFKKSQNKMHTASHMNKSLLKSEPKAHLNPPSLRKSPKTSPAPPPPALSAETPKSLCTQCSQVQCMMCKPGRVSLVVDMKGFSKTFGSEMVLCTMCEHCLCPGNSLVVSYRCQDCKHDGCEKCATKDDEVGEEWVICCSCVEGG